MTDEDRYGDLDQVWSDRAFKWYADFTDHPVCSIATWVASIVALCAVLSLIGNATGIVSIYWQAEKAKLTVNPRVTQQVYSTGNALSYISYFHRQCNNVLADQQNVQNAEQQLIVDKQTFAATSDPIAQQQAGTAVTQDESVLIGTKDQLSNDVRDYNAHSADRTSNPFKASGLPVRIQLNKQGLLKGSVNCR